MKKPIYLIILFGAFIFFAYLFRYDYTEDKQARIDRFTQNYEINCHKKNSYLSIEECSKLTPEEIFIKDKNNKERLKKEQEEKDLQSQIECKKLLEKARLDYNSEMMKYPSSHMLDWHSFMIKQYEKKCS